jgi:hypothetical protein
MKTTPAMVISACIIVCALGLSACGGSDTSTCTSGITTLCDKLSDSAAVMPQTPASAATVPATAGQIAFVSALPQNISMKGTGGPGRQESSTVTFKVLDKSGNPVAGTLVNFFVFSNTGTTTGTGGLTLSPSSATSGADGGVSTVVHSGIVNTPVRISATISGTTPALTSISDQLVISTGIPDQNSFTASPVTYNIECLEHDRVLEDFVTAYVADHFNNPVPDGTAVSFTTEGGAIDASCLTGMSHTTLTDGTRILQKGRPGYCSDDFICQNPRPADGRVTVLAYALGEESFADDPAIKDGINRYDPGEPFQDLREPFRYDRAVSNSQAMAANVSPYGAVTPAIGEPFIDTDGNGIWNSTGDGYYNGVLNADPVTQQTVANGKSPTVHVRQSFVLVFSGSTAAVTPLSTLPLQLERCVTGTPFVNFAKTFAFAVRDTNSTVFPGNTLAGNILPAGTTIEFATSLGEIAAGESYIVPNTNASSSAAWTYPVAIQSTVVQGGPSVITGDVTTPAYVCENAVTGGLLTIKVTTPLGTVTTWSIPISN